MTASTTPPTPKHSETDPSAANQPLGEEDLEQAGGAKLGSASSNRQPTPASVPGAESRGGQVRPGKPDGEVDTRP
jgi:hypothetical protein